MKLILVSLVAAVLATSSCDHCLRLSENNFEYLPMLEGNYCEGDFVCESILRDLSYKVLLDKPIARINPCNRDPLHTDCTTFSWKVCSDVLGENCGNGFVRDEQRLNGEKMQKQGPFRTNRYEIERNDRNEIERNDRTEIINRNEKNEDQVELGDVQKQRKAEVSQLRQKFLGILKEIEQIQATLI